jgi:hypothetical protein
VSTTDEVRACHELLLRLAGRLPRQPGGELWRLRDWLAGGALRPLARVLPRLLLRGRVGLTADEQELLRIAVLPWGADAGLVDAVLPIETAGGLVGELSAELPGERGGSYGGSAADASWDIVDAVVAALLRGDPQVLSVGRCWWAPAREDWQRVLLVDVRTGYADPAGLTGQLQRVLRATGSQVPQVEVLPQGIRPAALHVAARRVIVPLLVTGPVSGSVPAPGSGLDAAGDRSSAGDAGGPAAGGMPVGAAGRSR